MKDILSFLSPIPDRTPGSGIYSAYIVRGGSIYAASRSKGLTAGVLLDSPQSFAVPAAEMDAALARMKEVTELTVEGDDLIVRGGRLKTSIQLCADEAPSIADLPDTWSKVPDGFINAIKTAIQFVGDRHWSAGVRLWEDRVTALSNAAGIDITLPGLGVEEAIMLPTATAEFLAAQEAPDGFAAEGGSAIFHWADDRWLRSQLLTDAMPEEVVKQIFDKAKGETSIPIDDDARSAYADAAALSDGTVWVRATGFEGRKGVGRASAEHAMKLGADHCSAWSTKAMDAMMSCATAWDPGRWPELTGFVGEGLRGAIVGVNK